MPITTIRRKKELHLIIAPQPGENAATPARFGQTILWRSASEAVAVNGLLMKRPLNAPPGP